MKNISGIMLALLLGYSGTAGAEDWQHWTTWSATHNISERTQVSMLAEAYWRDNMSDDYVYDEYITYSRKLGHGFGAMGQAYFETVQPMDGEWNGTRSAVMGLSYTSEFPSLFRLRIEDRLFYRLNSPADWDYHRPRLTVTRDLGPVILGVSDEMRVDLSRDRPNDFYRNRLFLSLSAKPASFLLLGLGYVRQSDKSGPSWNSVNVLQTIVTVVY